MGAQGGFDGRESACSEGDLGLIPGLGDPLEKEMATHFSILAGQSPWTEEPGGLQSMGSQESHTAEHRHTLKILSRCFRCRMYYASVVWESPCSMGSPGLKRSLRDVGNGWVV